MTSVASQPLKGGLYVVATPIGNLKDITLRALETLKNVDLILAEDTRLSRRLLEHYGITTPLLSCHEHNEVERTPEIMRQLQDGRRLALISDAGTPAVSDPGYRLVKAVGSAGFTVVPIPGPSAAITAISASGLPSNNFAFVGFVPKKHSARQAFLARYTDFPGTLIFYESPHRVKELVQGLREIFGDQPAVLARELTKLHEEFARGSLDELQMLLTKRECIKGECVILLDNTMPPTPIITEEDLAAEIEAALQNDTKGTAALAKELAKKYTRPKAEIYQQILRIKANEA